MSTVAQKYLACALAVAGVLTTSWAQQPFALDTTFRSTFDTWAVASILPRADGKVIISGQIKFAGDVYFRSGALLNADGTRDPVFPDVAFMGGKLTPWNERIYSGNGSIVRRQFLNGSLDPDFILLNANPFFTSAQGGDYHVFPDGRLVMSGLHTLSDTVRGFTGLHNFIWFTNTGHLDTTRTHRKGNGEISTFKELPDGKFIASGSCTVYDGRPTSWIQRMHPDGALDTTFFTGVNWGRAYTYLPLADGRVYAGGLFRIAGMPDTLHLVRLMPDGSLDPSFNNFLRFGKEDLSGVGAIVYQIQELTPGILLVVGRFRSVDDTPRLSIALMDTTGNLLDLTQPLGCGPYTYQGYTYGTLQGAEFIDEEELLVYGAYHGFQDGIIDDPAQRFVSRLHVGDINLAAPAAPTIPFQPLLRLHPNPTQAWVAVDYDLQPNAANAQLLVKDGTGRVIHSQRLSAPRGQVVLDTRPWAKGLYTVELLQDGHRIQGEKLVVQ